MYALNTVYFLCAVIGLFTISNLLVKFSPQWLKRTKAWRLGTSLSRYMAYRGYRFPALRYCSPSLGVITLLVLGTVFFFGMNWSCLSNLIMIHKADRAQQCHSVRNLITGR